MPFLLFIGTANAQTVFIERDWTSKDGFDESNTFSIAQTGNGDLIAIHGTPTSIHHIDGYQINTLPPPSNTSKIVIDQQDHIWACISANERTQIIGFQRLQDFQQSWEPFLFQDFLVEITIPVTHWSFHVVSPNEIVFAADSSIYLFRIEDASLTTLHQLDKDNPYSQSSSAHHNNMLLFPHQKGITELTLTATSPASQFQIKEIPFTNAAEDLVVQNITRVSSGKWFGAATASGNSTGWFQILKDTFTYTPYHPFPLSWGWEINTEAIALINNQNELTIQNRTQRSIAKTYPLKSTVQDCLPLKENPSFVLATTNGVKHFLPSLFQPVPPLEDEKSLVHAMVEDSKQRLWLAAVDCLWKREQNEWTKIPLPNELQSAWVMTDGLIEMPDGKIVINVSKPSLNQSYEFPDYILLYDPTAQKFETIPHPNNNPIFSIISCKSGGLWLKTKSLEPDKYILEHYQNGAFNKITTMDTLPDLFMMRSLAETDNGDIWISHVDSHGPGVFRNGVYTGYGQSDGYTGSGVYSLMIDDKNRIWAGSRDSLFLFEENRWKEIRSGLDSIRTIFQSRDGSIWVASGNGLHHYKYDAWITYTEEDGLPSSHVFEVYEDHTGKIWIGTSNGICVYYPEYDPDPPITVLQHKSNSSEFSHNSLIQFTVSGVDKWKYTPTDDLMFSHQINAEHWSPFISSSNIQIEDLQPGGHTLRVRAMDRNFNIDPAPATFEFYIHPIPLQDQPYFLPAISITILILAALTFLLFESRTQLRYYTKHLESLVEDRTKRLKQSQQQFVNAIEKEQERIGNELHDGVVQDLAAIAMTGSVIAKELKQSNLEFAQEVNNVVEMIDRSSKQIRHIAKGLSPIQLDSTGLVSTIEQLASQISSTSSIQCLFHYDDSIAAISAQKLLHVYRFIQEAVSNAVKHANATAIIISVTQNDGQITIQIRDNGIGFDLESHRNTGLGIHTLQYRSEELGGTLTINSSPQSGTEVICTVKKDKSL